MGIVFGRGEVGDRREIVTIEAYGGIAWRVRKRDLAARGGPEKNKSGRSEVGKRR